MKKIRFAILGTRGIPAEHGGFETFAEELGKRLVRRGAATLVVGDSNLSYSESVFEGVDIAKTDAHKPANPLQFYFQSLKIAREWSADFVLMCGVGGNMVIPFFRKEFPIAVNPDGLGFRRDKYNAIKKVLFYTQYLTTTFTADYLVCDSEGIKWYYRSKFLRKKNVAVIEYGTTINPFINKKNLEVLFRDKNISYSPGKYHLIVSRLEPENNVKMILNGYLKSEAKLPLVIVGSKNTPHSKELIDIEDQRIHFMGGIYDKEKLQLLRAGCYSYWHGHSVGGTNPSLLEAMGSANLCVCHNNMFNKELVKNNGYYFSNKNEVSGIFNEIEEKDYPEYKMNVLQKAETDYSWNSITERYLNYAEKLIKKHSEKG